MSRLLDLETKLTVLSNNPCACKVCRDAARFAKHVLRDVSLSGSALLDLPQGTPEFAAAERKFQQDEIARLQDAYDSIGGRCQMIPMPKLDTPIPELPDAAAWRDKIEHYRKHSMKPRMTRRARIEMKNNPRVPGSYWIK
jgi:hypothetical protein